MLADTCQVYEELMVPPQVAAHSNASICLPAYFLAFLLQRHLLHVGLSIIVLPRLATYG